MVISVDLTSLASKLESICKNFYQRKDIAVDNRLRFSDLELKFRKAHKTLQKLQSVIWDEIRETKLEYFKAMFERILPGLDSLQQQIQGAKASDRVKRMKELLDQLEAKMKEFDEFVTEIALPAYDKQNENLNACAEYKPLSNVPPNPPYLTLDYNSKDTREGQLKAAVLGQVGKKIVGVIASGLGGTGKTCALRGLARDAGIKNMFPGGTLYIQLGNNSNIFTVLNGVARIVEVTGNKLLAREVRGLKTLEEVVDTARVWFYGAKCLLLVDDIWHVNGIDYNCLSTLRSMLSDECCLVYTTRDQRFKEFSDRVINFEQRDPDLAGRMLRAHGGFGDTYVPMSGENASAFREVVDECAGLPLALGIAGASVRKISEKIKNDQKEKAWAYFAEKLSLRRHPITSGSTRDYGKLEKIVDTSLNLLKEDYREKFRALCVIRKQQTVPLGMLRRLWNLESLDDTELVVTTLHDVSLIQWFVIGGMSYIQLHDLVLDIAAAKAQSQIEEYCRSLVRNYASSTRMETVPNDDCRQVTISLRTGDAAGADVVQKPRTGKRRSVSNREGGRTRQRREADSWAVNRDSARDNARDRNGDSEGIVSECAKASGLCIEWWNVDDDGYIHDNLCVLLRKAKYGNELKWLLSKPQWVVKRLRQGGIYELEQDLGVHEWKQDTGRGWDAVDGEEAMHKKHLDMIARAARMSLMYVQENPREAWFQMHGRLQWHAQRCAKTLQFVEEIEKCAPRPWVKSSLGFLHQAGGPGAESIRSRGRVLDVHQSEEDVTFLWARVDDDEKNCEVGVTRHNVRSGTRQEVVQAFHIDTSRGDVSGVVCGAMSRDEKMLTLGHKHGEVTYYDVMTGTGKTFLARHTQSVSCVSFIPGTRRIVSGSWDNTIRIWDTESGEAVGQPLQGHTGPVVCVAVTADGRRIVSGSEDETIRIWDTESGEAVGQPLQGHTSAMVCVAVTADGRRIVSGSEDETIRIWDMESGDAVGQPLQGHTSAVWCVAVTADGRRIVSGSDDETIRIWDMESGDAVGQPLQGHTSAVVCVAVTADGRRIVSGSSDNTIRIWDMESGEAVGQPLQGHAGKVQCVAVTADGRRIVFSSDDRSATVWDVSNGTKLGGPFVHSHWVEQVGINEDGSKICMRGGGGDWSTTLWNVEGGESMHVHTHNVELTESLRAFSWSSRFNSVPVKFLEHAAYYYENGIEVVLATFDRGDCRSVGDTYFSDNFDSFCRVIRK